MAAAVGSVAAKVVTPMDRSTNAGGTDRAAPLAVSRTKAAVIHGTMLLRPAKDTAMTAVVGVVGHDAGATEGDEAISALLPHCE